MNRRESLAHIGGLKRQNHRPEYLKAWWKWDKALANFKNARA
jgi:hypothetical protein